MLFIYFFILLVAFTSASFCTYSFYACWNLNIMAQFRSFYLLCPLAPTLCNPKLEAKMSWIWANMNIICDKRTHNTPWQTIYCHNRKFTYGKYVESDVLQKIFNNFCWLFDLNARVFYAVACFCRNPKAIIMI